MNTTVKDLYPEILMRIFSFLPADQLELATSVCRQWNHVIKTNRGRLPHHQLGIVRFTFDREWRIYLDYKNIKIRMSTALRGDNEQFYGENLIKFNSHRQVYENYKPSCGSQAYEPICSHNCLLDHTPILKRDYCNMQISYFTSFFWNWCRRVFKHSTVNTFIFCDCFFTLDFIHCLNDVLKELHDRSPYKVRRFIVHGCAVVGATVEDIHRLFFERIAAEEYIFGCITGAEEEIFSWTSLIAFPAIRRARLVHVFGVRGPSQSLYSRIGPSDYQLIDAAIKTEGNFMDLESLQVSGLNLSETFLETFLEHAKQSNTNIVSRIYVDDLQFQKPIGRWTKIGENLNIRKYSNDRQISISHSPLRTTIFTSKIFV